MVQAFRGRVASTSTGRTVRNSSANSMGSRMGARHQPSTAVSNQMPGSSQATKTTETVVMAHTRR